MHRANRQAGFSMAEMMVVTLVAGITLAATIPAMGRFMQTASLDSSAKQMVAHMRLTRQKAVSEGEQYLFLWYDSSWYYIIRDDDGNGYYSGGEHYDGPFWLPDGIYTANATGITTPWIQFRPNGSCSESGTFQMYNARGSSFTMTLMGPTGQVIISKDGVDDGA
jgi:prepilin-type N-terminal cleavage/methylation domain-containing protein